MFALVGRRCITEAHLPNSADHERRSCYVFRDCPQAPAAKFNHDSDVLHPCAAGPALEEAPRSHCFPLVCEARALSGHCLRAVGDEGGLLHQRVRVVSQWA